MADMHDRYGFSLVIYFHRLFYNYLLKFSNHPEQSIS